jgi:hypothetical protein
MSEHKSIMTMREIMEAEDVSGQVDKPVIRGCFNCAWASEGYWLTKEWYYPKEQQYIQCTCPLSPDVPDCMTRRPMKIALKDEGNIIKTYAGKDCPGWKEKDV